MKYCETCKFRVDGLCTSEKMAEGDYWYTEDQSQDMLIYSYTEDGSFAVGPKFGCIHHEEKVND